MESQAIRGPPFLVPHETPLSTTSLDEIPKWHPSELYPRPPPLPSNTAPPAHRSISTKQYRERTLLPAALADGASTLLASAPLLPTDLPSIRELIARHQARSDSEDAVTSTAAAATAAEDEYEDDDGELERDLEQAMMEQDEREKRTDEENETKKRKLPSARRPPRSSTLQKRDQGGAVTAATRNHPPLAVATPALEIEEETEHHPVTTNCGVDVDVTVAGSAPRTLTDTIIEAALKAVGFPSWDAFAAEIIATTADVAATTSSSSRRRKKMTASTVTVHDVLNPNSPAYHARFQQAYHEFKTILTREETKKQKAEALKNHSSILPERFSSLSAVEHTWFLQREGQQLLGSDAERYRSLSARIEVERRQYWAAVHAEAVQHQGRYAHKTDRQSAQLQTDVSVRKRRAVESGMPREWRLRGSISLHATINTTTISTTTTSILKKKNTRKVVGATCAIFPVETEMLRRGVPSVLHPVQVGTFLSGQKVYLPVQVQHSTDPNVYRKMEPSEIWEDSNMRQALENNNNNNNNNNNSNSSHFNLGGEEEESVVVVVCATAGAIQCLLRSALLQHRPPWQIPVVIEDEEGVVQKDGGETPPLLSHPRKQRCVYLGKPLLPDVETLREKQRRLHKYAVLSEACRQLKNEAGVDGCPRESVYWLTRAGRGEGGGVPLVIRTHARVLVEQPPSNSIILDEVVDKQRQIIEEGQGAPPFRSLARDIETVEKRAPDSSSKEENLPHLPSRSCVFDVSTEYLPEPDAEEDTPEKLAHWWAKLMVTPGAEAAAIAHVLVPINKVVQWRTLTAAELETTGDGLMDFEAAKHAVDAVVEGLKELPPGKYLLKHAAGEKAVQLLQEEEGVDEKDKKKVDREEVYDLHAAQARAGAEDTHSDPFVPPRWRPFREDIAQVPFTFPVDIGGGGRGRGKGGRGGRGGRGGARKRQRNMPWQGDMDQVQHVATISRDEYQAGLYEEL